MKLNIRYARSPTCKTNTGNKKECTHCNSCRPGERNGARQHSRKDNIATKISLYSIRLYLQPVEVFYEPGRSDTIKLCCVALFNALFFIEQSLMVKEQW